MTTLITIAALIVVLISLPLLIIIRITETQPERIARLSRAGWSQRAIAAQLGCSRHQVRRALALA